MNPGGVGDRCGLKAGDAVLSINNKPSDELEHEAAKYEILRAGNQVEMLIQRSVRSTSYYYPIHECKKKRKEKGKRTKGNNFWVIICPKSVGI